MSSQYTALFLALLCAFLPYQVTLSDQDKTSTASSQSAETPKQATAPPKKWYEKWISQYKKWVLSYHTKTGCFWASRNKHVKAIKHFQKAIEWAKEVYGEGSAQVVLLMNKWAFSLNKVGKKEEAETAYKANIHHCEAAFGLYNHMTISCYQAYAFFFVQQNNQEEAIAWLQKSLDVLAKRKQMDPSAPSQRSALQKDILASIAHVSLGEMSFKKQLFQEAKKHYEEAIELLLRIDQVHPLLQQAYTGIEQICLEKGDKASAETYHKKAQEIKSFLAQQELASQELEWSMASLGAMMH